ncbi:hypothetical protein SL003B_3032 [Polymorphum gilvum SL003B-26A1]|uniref:Uncharacterized protein n=1 Tax=Polymorphum gilvum (strain LMG 25793 / CGMCC 1.9160 / SL003B-26A1) TaxID=991905 RepID=F2IW70_POLGS|nr:hypothetical protein SL003B_3032 [Polymorphum gilvum SL003B-26A1]
MIIYGAAVQEARNRLRSAQISTMVDALNSLLFLPGTEFPSAFAGAFSTWVGSLQAVPNNARANAALAAAKVRAKQFADATTIYDIFAIGDVLRYLGEFFEFGGDPTVDDFRKGLRNQIAFNEANRARRPVPDVLTAELPDLGIFKNRLLDRSVVKYMERFYGPYLGADISGTTTDALDVLAYYIESLSQQPIGKATLQAGAASEISLGYELVPIATMVLQYHHSLVECGLALALPSVSASPGAAATAAELDAFNPYDFGTLTNQGTSEAVQKVVAGGNATLDLDLAGTGLVVLRDAIDIERSPYADVEIGLLVSNPRTNPLFQLQQTYRTFSEKRVDQMLSGDWIYQKSDPSLAAIAENKFDDLAIDFDDLIKMNSLDLKASGHAHGLLDPALAAAGGGLHAVAREAEPKAGDKDAEALSKHLAGVDPEVLRKALALASSLHL